MISALINVCRAYNEGLLTKDECRTSIICVMIDTHESDNDWQTLIEILANPEFAMI